MYIWAAITGVDEELYEAAYIDGANRFNRLWHITRPGIRTTISVMLILQVGNLLSVNFDQIYILINDMVLETGETLDYYVYRVGLYSTNNFSQATAVGLIKSLIGFVLVITTNIITKKMTDGEGGDLVSQHIVISKKERVFDWVNTVIMLLVIILTLYPFWYVIVASVSSISHVTNSVVLLWPDGLHWDAYQQVFRNNLVPTAYANTIFITLMGTVISMLLTCASAFVLSRKELPGRRLMTLFVVFTMLFNAGLVPFYLLVRDVGLLNTRWSLILPFAVSTYNTIIMRNFFQGVPNALYEAASIDGCSYFKYFLRILLPISLPSIATITLTFFHEVYTSIRQRIGVIMCSISKDRLFRLLQNVEGMMVTNAQDILYTWDGAKHPMPEQLQAGAWFENNAYYIAQPLERLGLTLLICTELQPLRAQALYNALVNMAAISFVGLLLLAVSHIQVRKMLSHLEQTRKAVIDLPEGADLSSRLPDTWNDEAGELAAAFKAA